MIEHARSTLFREVNERIAELADSWGVGSARGFLCECDESRCAETLELTRAEYEDVRAHPARFVAVHAHVGLNRESIVQRSEGYVVVEKFGAHAAEAEESDPRAEERAESRGTT